MSLRKIAGLLVASGVTIGLIGGGVGAVFHDQVTARENIDVGTFACKIVDATPKRRRTESRRRQVPDASPLPRS